MNNFITSVPKISVVMLNYNGLQYLKRTIPPILELNYFDYEFIVVDNGSTDGSLEFIQNIKEIKLVNSPRIREKNFACNYAIEESKGEYVLLLDNDLLITNANLLNELMVAVNSCNTLGSISLAFVNEGEYFFKDYGGFLNLNFIKTRKIIKADAPERLNGILIGFSQGCCLFIKRSIWQNIGGYDDYLKFGGDDNDLGIRLWLGGYKNYLYSKTLQKHIGLPERLNNKKYALKFKEMSYAHLYTIVKDFKFFNMLITVVCHSIFMFLKSIKQSIFRLNLAPLAAFFMGYCLFLRNLPAAIRRRKEIQSKRVIKKDIFLKIKPPKLSCD